MSKKPATPVSGTIDFKNVNKDGVRTFAQEGISAYRQATHDFAVAVANMLNHVEGTRVAIDYTIHVPLGHALNLSSKLNGTQDLYIVVATGKDIPVLKPMIEKEWIKR